MTKEDIINACHNNHVPFVKNTKGISYEKRGVLTSEALLIASIAHYFNVPLVLESGRARGHSTQLLAEAFKNTTVQIISIDYEKNDDTAYSEKILEKYPSVEMYYGDAHQVLAKHISDDCIVFIDGPKGEPALSLTADLLQNKKVKAVLVHDLSQNRFVRNIAEVIFDNCFFSDDNDFVEKFKNVDEECWKLMSEAGSGPYMIHGKTTGSYGPTIGVFFNSDTPMNEPAFSNYQQYVKDKKPTLKKALLKNYNHDSLLYKTIRGVYRLFKK